MDSQYSLKNQALKLLRLVNKQLQIRFWVFLFIYVHY